MTRLVLEMGGVEWQRSVLPFFSREEDSFDYFDGVSHRYKLEIDRYGKATPQGETSFSLSE